MYAPFLSCVINALLLVYFEHVLKQVTFPCHSAILSLLHNGSCFYIDCCTTGINELSQHGVLPLAITQLIRS